MVDPFPILDELLLQNIIVWKTLPAKFAAVERASGGRSYGLTIDVNLTDRIAMNRLERLYYRECEKVLALIESGMALADAWQQVRLASEFPDR